MSYLFLNFLPRLNKIKNVFMLYYSRFYTQKVVVNLDEPVVQKYLSHLLLENETLQAKDERNAAEIKKMRELKPLVNVLTQRFFLQSNINNLRDLSSKEEDEEVKKMIRCESEIYHKQMSDTEMQLQSALLEHHKSESSVLLEISIEEGEQAEIFAKELFDMYKSYAAFKLWDFDTVSIDKFESTAADGSNFGIKKASVMIQGLGAFELMNIEAGMHHRIVADENFPTSTSTVFVSVKPQPTEVEFDVTFDDLTVETKQINNTTGDGTTYSCVRITHTPTGTTVECKEFESNDKNERIALRKLRTLLFQMQEEKMAEVKAEQAEIDSLGKNAIIRSYDHILDRVIEHREGDDTQHKLKTLLQGDETLERLQESLIRHQRYENLIKDIDQFVKNHNSKEEEVHTIF